MPKQTKPKYKIHNSTFKDKASIKHHVSDIRRRAEPVWIFGSTAYRAVQDPEDVRFLIALLKHHPQWKERKASLDLPPVGFAWGENPHGSGQCLYFSTEAEKLAVVIGTAQAVAAMQPNIEEGD